MDLATTDSRAHALAPHVVVVTASELVVEWLNPETGTTCRLESTGEYAVLRRVGSRVIPVVAGHVLPEEAAPLIESPESQLARRAAAHAIVVVDQA